MTSQHPLRIYLLWLWVGVTVWGTMAAGPPSPDVPVETATQPHTVRVCVYNFAPLLFQSNGRADGFFIDLTKYVAAQEGWALEYVFTSFAECLKHLEAGQVDVLPGIAATPARLQLFDFTTDHYFLDWAVIYQPDGANIASVLDLQDKRVAVLRGSVFPHETQILLDQFGVQAQLVELDEYPDLMQAVASGQVDAGVCTNVLGLQLESHYVVERTQIIFAPVKIRFAFKKDATPEVAQAFDTHLSTLKADPNSLYHTRQAEWLEARPDTSAIPEWVVWGAGIGTAALLGLLGLTAAMRALVHRRTRQLREANHALAQSEAAYRAMFEKNQAIKLLIDPATGALMDVNSAAVAFYGYSREQLLALRITDLNTLPPEAVRAEMARAVTESRTYFNFQHRLANGDVRDVEVYSGPVEIDERPYLHSIVHDITERKRAEATLRASEAKFAKAFLANPDAVSISLLDTGEFLEVNEAFERVFGFTRAEAVGRTSLELNLLSLADRARLMDEIQTRGRVHQLILPAQTKTGDVLTCQLDGETMTWEGRVCLVSMVHDVTQQKQTEAVDAARLRLMDYSFSHSLDELLQKTLDEAEALTHSRVAFYHFVEADQETLALQMWSTRTLQEYCRAEGKGWHYPVAQAGVWVDCVYARQPVIHNDYASLAHRKGLPPGHAELLRELVVPIFRGDRLVAILGVGNKPTDYVARDVEMVHRLADLAWDIAERKRAEQALRDSEAALRKAQGVAHVGSWVWLPPENRLEWSDEMFHVFGLERATFTGDLSAVIASAIHPADRAAVEASNASVVERQRPTPLEYRVVWPDGSVHWVWAEAGELLLDENGHTKRLTGIVQDITERKQAEEQIRRSEERYRLLFENLTSGFALHEIICDPSGRPVDYRFLEINPAFEKLTGLTASMLMGKTVREALPGTEAYWIERYGQVALTGEPLAYENYSQELNKHYRVWAFCPRRGQFAVMFTDVTEHVHAEAKLRQLSRAVEQSPTTIIITDTTGAIQYANPRFEQTTGYTVDEALGHNPRLLKSGETLPEEYRHLWETLAAGGEWRGEFHNKRKDGTLYWESATLSPIKDEAGRITHFLAVKEDITERKRAEAKLAATNTRLEQALWEANQLAIQAQAANRLKSEILANTSHELRTPLTGVIGSLSVILEGLCDTREEEHSFLETAYQSSRNLLDLINNLLDLAKIEAGKMDVEMRAVAVAELLAEVGALCRAQAMEKRLALRVAPAPQPPIWVQADPEKVRQILLNLVNNAIKFTERGGVDISLQADPRAGEAYVRVRDTGVGVALDQQAKLFQPFVQADGTSTRQFGGTGLGLSLSRQLAELMGGQLTLDSAGAGQGAMLTLTLPLAYSPEVPK